MRALYIRVPTATYLRFCHNSLPAVLSLNSPFLILHPTKQYPSLRNSNPPHRRRQRPIITASSMTSSTPSTAQSETETENKPFSVLFVCLGNICRSPAAEGVFTDLVKKRGLDSKFSIDSAGTINYHEGNEADPRMRAAAKRRGIMITSISRPIRPSDFRDFDLILAMDKQNREDILGALERWGFRETLPADAHKKVQLMCSYCKKHDETEVPDPYYGGPQGFEKDTPRTRPDTSQDTGGKVQTREGRAFLMIEEKRREEKREKPWPPSLASVAVAIIVRRCRRRCRRRSSSPSHSAVVEVSVHRQSVVVIVVHRQSVEVSGQIIQE